MNCPECKSSISEESNFCPICGAKTIAENSAENAATQKVTEKKRTRKKRFIPLIILSVIAVTAIAIFVFFFVRSKTRVEPPLCKGTVVEAQKLSSFEKIYKDYEDGTIDVNTYFTQLFYHEYDSEKMDAKYVSDYSGYAPSENDKLYELMLEHYKDIDRDILIAYIEEIYLKDVTIVNREDKISANGKAMKTPEYSLELLSSAEAEMEKVSSHELDKVILSPNKHFLIWYTDSGADEITDDQAESIAAGLENAVKKYKEIFDVDFSYSPLPPIPVGKDNFEAASVLRDNGISELALQEAMNVYIFDTGNNNVCATHIKYSPELLTQILVHLGVGEIALPDGAPSSPYIRINRRGFDNEESLQQLYSHELFHEYQDLYTEKTTGKIVVGQGKYIEATANLAAALVADYNNTDNFLNDWASVYFRNDNVSLQEITDSRSYGYGVYPYFYVYSQEVDNWAEKLMYAHTTDDPYHYLKDCTDHEDFKTIADKLSYYLLTNGFDKKALHSNSSVSTKTIMGKSDVDQASLNAGSFVIYEIRKNVNLTVKGDDRDSIVINLYGYKNGRFTELASGTDNLTIDNASYPRYEKFYLTLNNADIITPFKYTVVTKPSELAPSQEFETSYDNYKVKIELDTTIYGTTTKTVSTGVIDEMHQKEYLETSITTGDFITVSTYSYHDFYSGFTYMTQPLDSDKWYKEQSQTQLMDLGIILDKLNNKEDITEKETDHYRIKLSGREAKGMLSDSGKDVSVIIGKVFVDVYTEDGYITKLDYDLSEAFTGTFGDIELSITFSDYDMAGDVNIPQEVITSATNEIVTSLPTDLESIGEFVEDNQSFFDTILNMFE